MPVEPKRNKKSLAILAVVLVLCGLVAAWLVLRSRPAPTPNMPPIAALRLDSIDETNRVATLSDGGSHDPDGTIQSWRIAWGDGKEETLSSIPQKAAHTYASEGEYTVSLWCVDNLGATSSPPAMTNLTFDFLKRQKALEQAQAEAKREADRLKEEEARKQAERLEQEKQKELAAMEAQKAKERQELEAKRKAEAELAQQKAKEAATPPPPPPTPLAAALPDNHSSRIVIYTPPGCTLGEFQIWKEGTAGMGKDGNLLVTLDTRCVNFPDSAVPTADWQIDGKEVHLQASRIRASLSPGQHEVTALFTPKGGLQPKEIKADVTVDTTGQCVLSPRK
jgi:PKD domain-containing protein